MVLLCTLLLQTWNNADAKFKSIDLCNITDQSVAMSSTSEPGSMHTAAGQRLHTHTRTQAACFRTGSSVKPAKHQLEAQIAQRHVQSHAAGSTEHHRQTQGQDGLAEQKQRDARAQEQSTAALHTRGEGVRCHAYKHTLIHGCKHCACMHYTILWQSSIRLETGYMHKVSTKTFAAGLRRTGVGRKKVLHCLKSSEVFVVA